MQKHLPFVKMSGAGNDFIVLLDEDLSDIDPSWLAERICTRALSVGADGLIVMSSVDESSAQMRFYNPDGSRAEMCGNGSRCAARFAVENQMVTGDQFQLVTDSGTLQVERTSVDYYRVIMPLPRRINLDCLEHDEGLQDLTVDSVQVGVPHCVVQMEGLDDIPDTRLIRLGRMLRYHDEFPNGANVNFVELGDDGAVRQRTYERGVENLTRACGTGATAVASVLMKRGMADPPVTIVVDGGKLTVSVENSEYWLAGDARTIYTGVISPEAVEW